MPSRPKLPPSLKSSQIWTFLSKICFLKYRRSLTTTPMLLLFPRCKTKLRGIWTIRRGLRRATRTAWNLPCRRNQYNPNFNFLILRPLEARRRYLPRNWSSSTEILMFSPSELTSRVKRSISRGQSCNLTNEITQPVLLWSTSSRSN